MTELYELNLILRSIFIKSSLWIKRTVQHRVLDALDFLFGVLHRFSICLFFSLHIPTRATTNDASEPPSHTEPTSEDRKNVSQEHIYEWILSMPQRFRDCIEKGGQLTGYYQPPWSKAITVCIIFCRPPNPLRMNEKL